MNNICTNCEVEFTITSNIKEGTYINCPICKTLIVDGFDYEDKEESF